MKPQEVTELDKIFNSLYCSLPYTNVLSLEDCLIFRKIPFGYNKKMVDEINEKIAELKLPLIAKRNEAVGLFADTIVVVPTEEYLLNN